MNEKRKTAVAWSLTVALAIGLSGCGEESVRVESTAEARFASIHTTVADGDVWLSNPDDGSVTRVDGESGEVRAVVDLRTTGSTVNPEPQAVTTDPAGDVWATLSAGLAVVRIDPETNKVVQRVSVDVNPYGIAATVDAVWISDFDNGLIVRIDRATSRETARITDLSSPTAIVDEAGSLWAVSHRMGVIARIDPDKAEIVDEVEDLGTLEGIAATPDALWVTSTTGEAVRRVDLDTLETESVEVGERAYGVAVGADGVWVSTGPQDGCDKTNSTVVLIDPETLRERGRAGVSCAFALGATPDGPVLAGTDEAPTSVAVLRWKG